VTVDNINETQEEYDVRYAKELAEKVALLRSMSAVEIHKATRFEIDFKVAWTVMSERLDMIHGKGFGIMTYGYIVSRARGRNEYGCMDSERACVPGDEIGEALYEYIKKNGCCGSHDGMGAPKKRCEVKIGYNYGH
jgi:hypothetical protein